MLHGRSAVPADQRHRKINRVCCFITFMTASRPKTAKALHPWSKDALLAKAQRYAEEMLVHDYNDWKFAFWSSLICELLARGGTGACPVALLAGVQGPEGLFSLYFIWTPS